MELSNNMKCCDFFLAAILLDFFPYLATQLTRSSGENPLLHLGCPRLPIAFLSGLFMADTDTLINDSQ